MPQPAAHRRPAGRTGANADDSCAIRLDRGPPGQLAADCAAAIRKLVEDADLRRRMGAAAREHAAPPTRGPSASSMAAIYDELAVEHTLRVDQRDRDAVTATKFVRKEIELGRGSTRAASTSSIHSSRTKPSEGERCVVLGCARKKSTTFSAITVPPAGGRLPRLSLCAALRAIRLPRLTALSAGCHRGGFAYTAGGGTPFKRNAAELWVELHLQRREES